MKLRLAAALLVAAAATPAALAATPRVLAVELENDINPVTQDYLNDAIDRAGDDKFNAVVIVLDTPGGLAESMRKIVKAELASRVPVLVYVSPDGSRAASAGVWIGQAADVLAMAPQTNIGSSTPISIGGEDIQKDLRRKIVNDAAAQLRALAKSHGRNAKWADSAVRQASNLTADEALRMNVIDVVATTLPELLKAVDGRKTVPRGLVLHTAGAEITTVEMGLWKRILDTLIDPNLIALFLSLGVLGIVVELWNPGLIFPATFGVVSLIVGFWGLQVLPISWAGLLLMLFAFAFWISELFIGFSHGALSLAGAVCFVFGSLLLFEPAGDTYEVSLPVVISVAAIFSVFFAFALLKVLQIRRQPAAISGSDIVGRIGEVRGRMVAVRGELWRARSSDGEPLRTGQQVLVEGVNGLELIVRPLREPTAVS